MSGRFDYVEYDREAQGLSDERKRIARELEALIDVLRASREKSLAMTKLEECFMWIGKAIREDLLARKGASVNNQT